MLCHLVRPVALQPPLQSRHQPNRPCERCTRRNCNVVDPVEIAQVRHLEAEEFPREIGVANLTHPLDEGPESVKILTDTVHHQSGGRSPCRSHVLRRNADCEQEDCHGDRGAAVLPLLSWATYLFPQVFKGGHESGGRGLIIRRGSEKYPSPKSGPRDVVYLLIIRLMFFASQNHNTGSMNYAPLPLLPFCEARG